MSINAGTSKASKSTDIDLSTIPAGCCRWWNGEAGRILNDIKSPSIPRATKPLIVGTRLKDDYGVIEAVNALRRSWTPLCQPIDVKTGFLPSCRQIVNFKGMSQPLYFSDPDVSWER
ncbi:hypothetical protein AVEN_223078-1 [Araneus ventricosus]|uniref:Uncharacterized protein n=1 Tax=Araneus ventricosus TaxID=182803 RepID=A0A4Y2AYB2_ARAVE|nr:hypothetical protein AVEN_248629-1 [Araneus ventricosus]GBL84140.1 hypothetical protein AVEN_78838-1 [Araneus ventricosus]GBL84179.1 hypothetical protein AVEN_160224-1 [Araneus ventricosus]GBL84191.1 hypothetical protein AVEN_223078-1 [Araneus ventricosus]